MICRSDMTKLTKLIALAAKAAGHEVYGHYSRENEHGEEVEFALDIHPVDCVLWNPLTNDGDALRLAVKLGMGISIPLANKRTDVVCFSHATLNSIVAHENDPYAATRRAIVRAAAEIGKGMK